MTAPEWVVFTATVIPLLGIAGSAIAYVIKLYQEAAERRRDQFFKLLDLIDGAGPIAGKVGAVYALREFKEHKEFVERFCATQRSQINGANAAALVAEFDATAAAISNQK